MLRVNGVALQRGVLENVVAGAANGQNDDAKSEMFSCPASHDLIQVQFQAVPSTGTMTDITTCNPQLQSLASDGTTWAKVTNIDLVAIPAQIISLIGGGVYKLTFAVTSLVTANGATVNIEGRLG